MTNPRLRAGALTAHRAKNERTQRYHEARQRARGMGGRESELAIVPAKRGNSPERTLWREGRAESWTDWRAR